MFLYENVIINMLLQVHIKKKPKELEFIGRFTNDDILKMTIFSIQSKRMVFDGKIFSALKFLFNLTKQRALDDLKKKKKKIDIIELLMQDT